MDAQKSSAKVSGLMNDPTRGAWRKYRDLVYGKMSFPGILWAEMAWLLFSSMGGGLGLFLRSRAYRPLLGAVGPKTLFGRNGTIRCPAKIRMGKNVIIDDNCLLDAKGESNRGIDLGDEVYIGRNSSVYCKNGDIVLGNRVNLSSSCTLMSANRLTIGEDTVIGAYAYLLSGGEYDYTSPVPYSRQSGMISRGPLLIGRNCWLGARVPVLDGASIGDHCVIGAGAVVTQPVPDHSLAVGVPAKVIKTLPH